MKTNNWRIAGRVLGVVSFLLTIAIFKDIVSGVINGLFWWGILEFIGWLVDRSTVEQSVATLSGETAHSPAESPTLQIVFNSAQEVIAYEEHQKKAKEEEQAIKAETDARQAETAAREAEEATQRRREADKASLDKQRKENAQRLEFERERTRLSKKRAQSWVRALSFTALVLVVLCSLGLPTFFLGAQFYREMSENQKLAAQTASEAESNLASQKAKTQATVLAKQEALEERKRLDALTAKYEAERKFEKVRLELVQANRERVEAEREVVMLARATPLVDLHDVPSNAELVKRERLLPTISAEREQIAQKILLQLHRTHAEQKAKLQASGNEPKVKLQQLEKLDQLLRQAKERISKTPLHLLKRYLSSSS